MRPGSVQVFLFFPSGVKDSGSEAQGFLAGSIAVLTSLASQAYPKGVAIAIHQRQTKAGGTPGSKQHYPNSRWSPSVHQAIFERGHCTGMPCNASGLGNVQRPNLSCLIHSFPAADSELFWRKAAEAVLCSYHFNGVAAVPSA